MPHRLRRPSPAMVVAVIALVLAMAGTGWAVTKLPAKSVGTTQLKDKAVTSRKLADAAVVAAKVSGDLPSAGIAKLTYVRYATTVPANTAVAATANCPAGTVAISGGAELPHSISQFILDSHPVVGTGWQAGVGNAGDAPADITIYAVCAKASPTASVTSVQRTSGSTRVVPFDR